MSAVWDAACLATFGYIVPIFVVWVLRAERDTKLWQLALDVPTVVACDMAVVLTITRFLPLSISTIVVRCLWIAGGIGGLVYRWRKKRPLPKWPSALTRYSTVAPLLGASFATLLSMEVSRACVYADRSWHVPLSSSIRNQTLPFANVYEPGEPLAYHFAGDVASAMLQTLSGAVLHANYTLSLAHDVMFGLFGLSATLLVWDLGLRRVFPAAIASLAPLFFGPAVLLIRLRSAGYNFINFYRVSFRPHTVVAALLVLGFAGAVLVRIHGDEKKLPWTRTALPLVSSTALLAITDEATIAILGLSVGIIWLAYPESLAEDRKRGMAVLGLLLVALLGASALFHGTLLTGVGEDAVSWVPARVPGYKRQPLELAGGWATLKSDLWPFTVLWVGGLITFLRRRRRSVGASFSFITLLLVIGVVLLVHIDVGERSVESHRFMTAAMLVMPLGALAWLGVSFRDFRDREQGVALSSSLIILGLVWGGAGSLHWLRNTTKPGNRWCPQPKELGSKWDFAEINCRAATGARTVDRPRLLYFERSIGYLYAGCRSTYAAGPSPLMVKSDRIDIPTDGRKVATWTTPIGFMRFHHKALVHVENDLLPKGQDLVLACHPSTGDVTCRKARRMYRSCERVGNHVMLCRVPAQDRRRFMATYPGQPPQ